MFGLLHPTGFVQGVVLWIVSSHVSFSIKDWYSESTASPFLRQFAFHDTFWILWFIVAMKCSINILISSIPDRCTCLSSWIPMFVLFWFIQMWLFHWLFFSHFIFFMVIDCHLVIPFNCSWVPAKVRFIKNYIRRMVTFNVSSSIRQYFLVWRPYPMNSSFSAFCLTFFPDSIRYAGIGFTPKHSKLTKIRHLPIPFLIRCCFLWGSCSWMILHVSGGSNCFFPVTLR